MKETLTNERSRAGDMHPCRRRGVSRGVYPGVLREGVGSMRTLFRMEERIAALEAEIIANRKALQAAYVKCADLERRLWYARAFAKMVDWKALQIYLDEGVDTPPPPR